MEDGSSHPVSADSVFALPAIVKHLAITTETPRAVALFVAAMFTQDFDDAMMPPRSHIPGTRNRTGPVGY